MKNNKMFSRLSIALVMMLVLSSVQSAFAVGPTTAGTTISSQASVTFMDGVNQKSKNSNVVEFKVGHKIAGALTTSFDNATPKETVDDVTVSIPITFLHQSNYAFDFKATLTPSVGGTTEFAPTSVDLYSDPNNTGVVGGSGVTKITTGNTGLTGTIPAAYSPTYTTTHFVLGVVVPSNRTDTWTSTTGVTFSVPSSATTTSTTNGVVPILNTDISTITVNAVVKIKKPVIEWTIAETAPGAFIPGATFSQTINITNTGTLATSLTTPQTFTLALGTGPLMWLGGSTGIISGDYTLTPTLSNDINGIGGTVTFTVTPALLTGASASFSLSNVIKIEQTSHDGVGPYTDVDIASGAFSDLSYHDGVKTKLTSVPTVSGATSTRKIASSVGAVWSTSNPVTANASIYETIEYGPFTLTNKGNTTSTFSLSAPIVSPGIYDSGYVFSTTPGGDAIIGASASIAGGASGTFYVRTTMPYFSNSGKTIATVTGTDYLLNALTATPVASGTKATGLTQSEALQNLRTNAVSASSSLQIALSVVSVNGDPVPVTYNPEPNDIIEYQILVTNGIGGTVTNVVITNPIDPNTTFVTDGYTTSGIWLDEAALLDNTGGLVRYSGSNIVTTSSFSVTSGSPRYIKFKVTVK